jgi:putative transposase
MKEHFTEEQIIGVLKEAEVAIKVAEVCRKYGISDAILQLEVEVRRDDGV